MSSVCRLLPAAAIALILAPPAAAAEPLRVVATVGMVADVVAEVGGSCVAVEALMGPGTDPHEHQATAGDVRRLQEADLIVYAGYGLEEQLSRVLEGLGARQPVLALMEAAIGPADLIVRPGAAARPDMHLWMDAGLWARMAPAFADALAEMRPDCAEAAEANAAGYAERLDALHGWVRAAVASIPEDQRVLVTAHDAFGYYARAYGIEVVSVQGISTLGEASVADIRDTVEAVVASGVPAVFVETTINPRTIQAVIDGARQRGHAVGIGGALYSDALGEAGTIAESYVGMIFENTRTIVEALGGEVPPLPQALAEWGERWDLPTT